MGYSSKLDILAASGLSMLVGAVTNSVLNNDTPGVIIGTGVGLITSSILGMSNYYDQFADLRHESKQREKWYLKNDAKNPKRYSQTLHVNAEKYDNVLDFVQSIADRVMKEPKKTGAELVFLMDDGRVKFHNFGLGLEHNIIDLSENVSQEIRDKILSISFSNTENPRVKACMADNWLDRPRE